MKKSKQSKPKKPWPSYPLFWHRNGLWCKKIRGNHHYFGTDSRAAHEEYIGGGRRFARRTQAPTPP